MINKLIILADNLDKIGIDKVADTIDGLIKNAIVPKTQEDELIRAIQADPDNEDLRAVYADFLDEQGENEDADYVRLQSLTHKLREKGHKAKRERICALARTVEVRCPNCKNPATINTALNTPNATYCNTEPCPNIYEWFNFHFEPGNKYKFANGTWIYYGGDENKWWVAV